MRDSSAVRPLDPDYARIVRESFDRQGLMRNFGARLVEVKPGATEIRVTFRDDLTQQHGYFHGGVSGAIADVACGYAAQTLMAAGSAVLTVEFKVNLLAPAQGEELIARAHVVGSGRTLTICAADVYGRTGDVEKHCATMLTTMMSLAGRSERTAG